MHIIHFKSLRDVMQISTLILQVEHRLELSDWCRDAASVPYGPLLVDLSPKTDDRLRYRTNTGSSHSKFDTPN